MSSPQQAETKQLLPASSLAWDAQAVPAAEECQEYLWSFVFTQTTPTEQAGLTPWGKSLPSLRGTAQARAWQAAKGRKVQIQLLRWLPHFRKAGWCHRGQSLGRSPCCGLETRAPELLLSLPCLTRT